MLVSIVILPPRAGVIQPSTITTCHGPGKVWAQVLEAEPRKRLKDRVAYRESPHRHTIIITIIIIIITIIITIIIAIIIPY